MQALERTLGSGKLAGYRLAALLVSVFAVTRFGLKLLPDWRNVKGWEAYWIAKSLAAGEGYSFPSTHRWLFDPVSDGGFHPTAWVDPLYTFCLAGLIRLFGDYHQLAAAVFNLVLLLAVFGLTYRLGERLISAPAGLIAVLTLSLIKVFPWTANSMNNTMLAATFIVLAALMLVKFLEGPSYRCAGILGLVLGLTALACPSAQLFIPIVAVAIVARGWKSLRPSVSQAILVLVVAAMIVLPWTVRNYLVFGKFVSIRTGAGQITFVGVVATAGTVKPELLRSNIKPPWSARTPRSAVKQAATDQEKKRALNHFQKDYAKEVAPAKYATMNEAQRDSWFLQETKAFLLSYPVLSAQLAITKIEVFVRLMGSFGTIVCLLAALGGFLAIRTPAVQILALWVGSYVGPYILIICYHSRYRAPIEPLLVVLAVSAVWRMIGMCSPKLRIECGSSSEQPTHALQRERNLV
jgi:4-amino-4-deoxy-L-arabinose transferase-like glycosyltransferase